MIDVLLLGRILRCGRRTQSFYCVQDDGHALDRVSKHDWLEHQPFFQGVIRFMNQTNLESQTLFYHNFHKKVIYIYVAYTCFKSVDFPDSGAPRISMSISSGSFLSSIRISLSIFLLTARASSTLAKNP
jgi:hypothetical protein